VLRPAGNPEPGTLTEPRGPYSFHLRVLVPGRRERREIQRRVRRINAQLRGGTKRNTPPYGAAGSARQDP